MMGGDVERITSTERPEREDVARAIAVADAKDAEIECADVMPANDCYRALADAAIATLTAAGWIPPDSDSLHQLLSEYTAKARTAERVRVVEGLATTIKAEFAVERDVAFSSPGTYHDGDVRTAQATMAAERRVLAVVEAARKDTT